MHMIYRDPKTGEEHPLRFVEAKMYDSMGKEVIVPKCESCGISKTIIYGKDSQTTICLNCKD